MAHVNAGGNRKFIKEVHMGMMGGWGKSLRVVMWICGTPLVNMSLRVVPYVDIYLILNYSTLLFTF